MPQGSSDRLRSLLILGRISNVPTVWSNCLAGWLLSGGGELSRLAVLLLGATLVYVAGMYLNDAFDADWDAQHRPERPIPSGAIPEVWVWRLGWAGLILGGLCLMTLSRSSATWAFVLMVSIVLYDALHKKISFAPGIMALCRLALLLTAAGAGQLEVPGMAVWASCALFFYIVGLSALARNEALPGPLKHWPALLLAGPIVLALVANSGMYRHHAMLPLSLFLAWTVASLWWTYWAKPARIGKTISWLLAGICLLDAVSVVGEGPILVAFLLLFGLALLLQRFIPAT